MSVGKTTRKAYAFTNVVASGDASNQIALGKTLNNFQLKLGGTALTKAMLTMIRIKANGKTIMEGTGTQFDTINKYRGLTANAAYLDIAFEDLTGLDLADRQVGALDTSNGLAQLTSEVTIAGATAPTLLGIVYEQAPQINADGSRSPLSMLMAKQLRYPYAQAVGGILPINLPFGQVNGAIIKRIHVFNTGGLMTGCTVKEDSVVIHESLKAENEYEQTRQGRLPQANCYTIDFVIDGDMRKALDTTRSKSLELLPEFSAADSGFVVVEYLDRLGNL